MLHRLAVTIVFGATLGVPILAREPVRAEVAATQGVPGLSLEQTLTYINETSEKYALTREGCHDINRVSVGPNGKITISQRYCNHGESRLQELSAYASSP